MHASMNRIYRLIWSHVHQTWVIVHERAKGKGKSANRRLLASVLLAAASHAAMAGPTGGQVTAGNGTINQNGATTTVTQASQNLSLNWQSFNTASGETVNFVQPSASAIAVNRISDNNATQFYGALNANGQVYLVNPNGVVFGSGSQINVGGLVASTLDINDASLNSATRQFSGAGTGSIINQGTINTANGGYVAFLGNTVRNQGAINAASGAVALGAGSDVTLSFSGNSLVQLQVNQSTLNNLAENGGLVKADGGAVWLSAGARDAVLASVVNNTGIIEARSVEQVGGTIVLGAGSAGKASNSGTLDASASDAGGVGGTVKVLGGEVRLAAGSAIDVSGDSGGGTALIGGNFLGTGPEMNAKTTTVEAGASINADAISAGHGGKVAVWSDGSTHFDGGITARGGAVSGNGGEVETSGKLLKISASAAVNTAAPGGKAGNWLLDPNDITIGNDSIWTGRGAIDVDSRALTAALNLGNVTIKTTASTPSCTNTSCGPGRSGNGDIILLDTVGSGVDYDNSNQNFQWTSSHTLTLSAYNDIIFKYTPNLTYRGAPGGGELGGVISALGAGNVVLRADNTAKGSGTVTFEDTNLIQNYVDFVDSASTLSIYYNSANYTPFQYSDYFISYNNIPTQLTAYMAVNVAGSVASKIYDGSKSATLTFTPPSLLPSGVTLDTSSRGAEFVDKNVGNNKAVTITGVTFTGGGTTTIHGGQHYYINGLDSATASITAKSLNFNVSANSKTYDGNNTATLTGAALVASGLISGDNVTLNGVSGVGTFASANAGAGQAVTVAGYTLSGTDQGNYSLTQPTGLTASINKANLVLTGTRTYDGTTTVAGSSLAANGVAGQTFAVTGAGDVSNLASKNVQNAATLSSVTGLSLGSSSNGGLASNYNVLGTAGSSYSVTPKGLTLSGIVALNKTYDATTTATLNTSNVSYSGLLAGDSVTLTGSGTGTFINKDVGLNKAVTVSGFTLGGTDGGNYVVTQPSGLTATISKANLAVNGITAAAKTYDAGTAATLTGSAFVTALSSDVVSVTGTGTGSFVDANAGAAKAVTVTGYTLSGTDAGNYNVVQPSGVTATINQASVTLSGSKTYDGTTAVAGSTLTATGVNGQTFAVTGAGNTSNLISKNVQSNTVLGSITGLSLGASSNGGVASNYVLSTTGSSYSVTAKGLLLSGITAVDKIYDATTAASLDTSNVSYSGLLSGDTVTLAGSGAGAFNNKNVGNNKTVTVSGYTLSGADAGNYVVSQPSGLTASISKADIAVSGLSAADKTYDATTGATLSGTASVTGLISDVISVSGSGSASFADKDAGTNKTVIVTGYTLSGTDAGNYNVVQPTGVVANISKANLQVTGVAALAKTYDATTGATLTGTAVVNGLSGDVVSAAGTGSGVFVNANAGAGKAVTVTGYTLSGADAGNYNVLQPAGVSATINQANVTLSGSKTYNGTTAVAGSTLTATGLNGQTFTVTGAGNASNLVSKDVQSGAVLDSITGLSLGVSSNGGLASNYVLSAAGSSYAVTPKGLVLSGITASNKTYDATTAAILDTSNVSYSGLVSGDSVTLGGTGIGAFNTADAGNNKAVTVSGYSLGGANAANYVVAQPSGLTANITPASVTLSGSKAYDGTTAVAGSSLTAVGLNGQTFAVTGAGNASNLVSKNVQSDSTLGSITGLSLGASSNGGLASNYVLSTVGSSYAVTPKGLVLSGITASNKTYDATTAASLDTSNVSYSGLVSGDSVTVSGSGTGTFNNKEAGSNKVVTVSGYSLSGTDALNYVVSQPIGLTATINKADLVVTGISAAAKTYDATAGATLSGTAAVSGLTGDVVSVIGTGAGVFADANAGVGKAVTVTGYTLSGADAVNYNVVQPTGVSATINQASLALSGSKAYDGTTAVAGSSLTAVGVNGQTFAVTGAGNASNLLSKDVQSGTVLGSITGLSLGASSNGGLASNYVLSTAGSSYAVTPKGLVLSGITASNKTYDATTTASLDTSNVSYSGLVSGDAVTLGGSGIGAFNTADAGNNKAVTVSGYILGGADAANYVVSQPGGLTANITPASVTLSGSKTYDGTTAVAGSTLTATGLNGQTFAVTGAGDASNLVSKDVQSGTVLGSITGLSLGASSNGGLASNYVLSAAGSSYAVTPKGLVLSGITASNKTYDATTAAILDTSNVSYSGLVSGDSVTLSGSGIGAFNTADAGNNKAVTVSGYSLGGANAANYVVAQPNGLTATITPASVTLSGSKTYDGTTAVAGSTLTAVGLNGQTFAVTGAGDASNLGNKNVQSGTVLSSITGLSLGASSNGGLASNYVLSTVGSSYAVTQKGITLTGISASDKIYDGSTAASINVGSVSFSGLVAGDSVTLAGSGTGSFNSKDAGSGKSVSVSGYSLGGADAANYSFVQPSGLTASISKASLAVSGITVADKTYDATTAASLNIGNVSYSGLLGGDSVTLASGVTGTFNSKDAGANKTVSVTGYSLAGADAGNYELQQPAGLSASINRANLVIGGVTAADKIYDATTSATLNGTASVSGLLGDVVAVAGAGSASFASKDAGANKAVSVTGYSLTGADAGNYVLQQPAGLSATINRASLVAGGVSVADKTYDATTGATLNGTASVRGLLNDVVTVAGTGSASFASKDAGANKVVSVTGYSLTGADAGNYVLAQPTGLSATINRASLVVGGVAVADKTYDATTGATLTGTAAVSGLLGDVVAVAGAGSTSFASKDAGANKAVSLTGYSLTGADAGNYVLAQPAGLSATINRASLVVGGVAAADKIYDATTVATLTGTATVSGLLGDVVAVAGAGSASFASKDAGANKAVSVTGYSLTGADAGNYVLVQPAGLSATINRASLVVSGVAAADKTYDATTSATLTGTAAVRGLLNDVVTVAGTGSASFASKDAGANKAVSVTGYSLAGADAGNYVLAQPAGLSATINRANLVVTGITAADKAFDGTTAATVNTGNVTLAGRLAADVITVAATGQFADAVAGNGKAVNLSSTYGGADLANYSITGQSQAFANIIAAPVVVPEVPVQPAPAAQPIQNTVAQLQASLLPPQASAQPQVLSLSSTLVVQQTADASSSAVASTNAGEERTQEPSRAPIINTTSAFGMPAPLLSIQNGGMQLPLVATSIKE